MQELNDTALLRKYVEENSEEAIATLIARHVDKVYSVALRHTRNQHQAEEITQAVFAILAKKSRRLDDQEWEIPAKGKLTATMRRPDAGGVILLQQRNPDGKAKIRIYADGSVTYRK